MLIIKIVEVKQQWFLKLYKIDYSFGQAVKQSNQSRAINKLVMMVIEFLRNKKLIKIVMEYRKLLIKEY